MEICGTWSGENGMAHAERYLGAAACRELSTSGISCLPHLYFTAGVHPHEAKTCDERTISTLRQLAAHPRCVSIGECGIDYDRMYSPREVQLKWCRKQVELAAELRMPLFLHERDRGGSKGQPLGSSAELLGILRDTGIDPGRVCIHCYTGGEEDLRRYVELGYFIGLTGFVGMHTRGASLRELLKKGAIPLNRLMIETDCPFMMPDQEFLPADIGMQSRKMEPCALPAVCKIIAELVGKSAIEVAEVTTSNAMQFFCL